MPATIKILHIEDVRSDAVLIARSLKKAGLDFESLIVETKKEYIDALDSFGPDIILSDHLLPDFDSLQALEILQASGKHIPFILITSVLRDEVAVNIIKSGASDYILKDRMERLPVAIENTLERFRLEREKQDYIDKITSNERRQRLLLENGTDPVLLMDAQGNINYTSPNVEKTLGYKEGEVLKMNLNSLYHPDNVAEAFEELRESLEKPGKTLSCGIKRMIHRDGSWRWVEMSLTNMLQNADVNGIINNLRDVTERRKSELAIRESETKYKAFFENSLDGILLSSPDGRIFAANPTACEMFKMTEKEICEAERSGISNPEDPSMKRFLEEREKNGKVTAELRLARKGGMLFPAEVTSTIFKDASGEMRTSLTIRDLSDKKLAEEQLKSSEEKYRLLFKNSPLPNWIYEDESLKIMDVNQAAVAKYGYSREEFQQMTIMELRAEEDKHQLLDLLKSFSKDYDTVKRGKVRHIKKDGSPVIAEVYGYKFQLNDKDCYLVIANDVTEKEKALEDLKIKSEQLTAAERIAKLGYWELNLQDDSLFWTDEVYRIWGRTRENFTPTLNNFLESIHPDDLERVQKAIEASLSSEEDYNIEHRIICPDGSVKWVEEIGKHKIKEIGVAGGVEGTVQDITIYKEAGERLVISEARFRSMIQSQTNYVLRVDLEGKYVYCNETFLKDYSWIYPNDSMIGKNCMSSINEYHHNRVVETVEKCFASPNTVFQVEIDKPAEDGSTYTTLWDFILLTDSKGNPEELQSVGINITERVQAEKANRFQANLLDKIGQAVLSTDIDGRITYWNKSAEHIYGWARDEVLGKSIDELIPMPDSEKDTFRNIKDFSPGEVRTGEYEVYKKNGTKFPALVTDSPIYDEHNNLIGMVGISTDITARRKAESKMRKLNEDLKAYTEEVVTANKGLEQFSYIVSHNLRAPVANIIGLGNLIREEDYSQEVKDQLTENLLDNVSRLDSVITDLNEILSVKSNVRTLKELVEMPKLVESIALSIQDLIDKENVLITTDFSEMNGFKTVRSYIQSILYNLILNSIKYRQPDIPPVIHIKGEKKGRKHIITVADNGMGIDLSKKKGQVFGLYKRFHNHVEGKGMGLFMVKTQVEILGGKISISSQPNEGTIFTMEFDQILW